MDIKLTYDKGDFDKKFWDTAVEALIKGAKDIATGKAKEHAKENNLKFKTIRLVAKESTVNELKFRATFHDTDDTCTIAVALTGNGKDLEAALKRYINRKARF